VRKWLLGLAIPTLDKLQVLAKLLDVSEDWLRWGLEHKTQEKRSEEETSLIQDYLLLNPRDQRVVRSLIEVFILQYAYDIEATNTPPPSHQHQPPKMDA
jgi:transcriptional regulator with XRE-family HTH domain